MPIDYLKSLYLHVFMRYFPQHYTPRFRNSVQGDKSKYNKAFGELYALLIQYDLMQNDMKLRGFFYYILGMSTTPLSPRELVDELHFLRYLRHGMAIGEQLVRQHHGNGTTTN